MAHLGTAGYLNPLAIHLIKNNTINYKQYYQEVGGREEEVTGGKVNYDLMLENIFKGRISWCVHTFKSASADLSIMHCTLNVTVGD